MKDDEILRDAPAPASPPSGLAFAGELRAIFDIGTLPLSWLGSAFNSKEGRGALPIILLPGFASDERYMKPLGLYLKNLGYRCEGWGLGKNLAGINYPHTLEQISAGWNVEPYEGYSSNTYRGEGGVPYLCDRAVERVRQRADDMCSKVILIGWSLGGYVAREVARDLPDKVEQVITLGSPVIGGPKYTKAAALFRARGFDLDWIERESGKRDLRPISQPITAIYSKTDAIVDWRAAIDKVSPNVVHKQIGASHLGMGFNREVFKIIRSALRDQRSHNSRAE